MAELTRLPSGTVTVPDDLAEQLRDVRDELTSLDERRDELVGRRDELIVTARRQGGSLREVADLVGLSHQAVKLIDERSR